MQVAMLGQSYRYEYAPMGQDIPSSASDLEAQITANAESAIKSTGVSRPRWMELVDTATSVSEDVLETLKEKYIAEGKASDASALDIIQNMKNKGLSRDEMKSLWSGTAPWIVGGAVVVGIVVLLAVTQKRRRR